jgi:hypothetical protein
MGAALSQLFATLVSFFVAFEKIGTTINNLATVAEETSGSYVDESRAKRAKQLKQLQADA